MEKTCSVILEVMPQKEEGFSIPVADSLYSFPLVVPICLQVSYAIGVAHPISVSIFHYGTSQKTEHELLEIVKKNFDLRPGVIVR